MVASLGELEEPSVWGWGHAGESDHYCSAHSGDDKPERVTAEAAGYAADGSPGGDCTKPVALDLDAPKETDTLKDESFDSFPSIDDTTGQWAGRCRVIGAVLLLMIVASGAAAAVVAALRRPQKPSAATVGDGGVAAPGPTIAPTMAAASVPTAGAPAADQCAALRAFTPPPPFPGKKGIGLRLEGDLLVENLRRVALLKPDWNYSWGLQRPANQPDGIEFVPMVWGDARPPAVLAMELAAVVESGLAQRILAYNEPDAVTQANLPVWRVLDRWPYLTATDLPIIGPSCFEPLGKWMKSFHEQVVVDCYRVDYVGVHWYGNTNVSHFQAQMREIYDAYQRPLVISEFAPADWQATTPQANRFSAEEVLAFAKKVIPWLEATDWVAAYAWFPFPSNSSVGTSSALFYQRGNLTALGRYYASVTKDNPGGDQWIESDY